MSGAHLYGFNSPDSDFDIRGAHALPLEEVIGLDNGPQSNSQIYYSEGNEIDLVTHDVAKHIRLLLSANGNALEQLYSPLIIQSTPENEELMELAENVISRKHGMHYLGYAQNQWKLFNKFSPAKAKHALYVFRILFTGLYLMETGIVNSNIIQLNQKYKLSFIEDLVAQKKEQSESCALIGLDKDVLLKTKIQLLNKLQQAMHSSKLPAEPSGEKDLNEFLIRIRLANIGK